MRKCLAIVPLAALTIPAGPALAQSSASTSAIAPVPSKPTVRYDPRLPELASPGPTTGEARMAIFTAVRKQVQPCADRQVIPAPEAAQITAVVQLNLQRDGSLANFRIVGHNGITEANQRYVPRVDAAVEAIFTGCTPFRGLPPELYDVPGGWRTLKFNYRLKN